MESIYKKRIDRLNDKLLLKDIHLTQEIRLKAELRLTNSKLLDEKTVLASKLNAVETKVASLTSDNLELREALSHVTADLTDTKRQLEHAQEDNQHHQTNIKRLEEQIMIERDQRSISKTKQDTRIDEIYTPFLKENQDE